MICPTSFSSTFFCTKVLQAPIDFYKEMSKVVPVSLGDALFWLAHTRVKLCRGNICLNLVPRFGKTCPRGLRQEEALPTLLSYKD